MARILLLTQVLPYPLDAGPKVRAYHMLRHLAGQHQVTLVSFTRADDPPEATAHLRKICAAVHAVPIRRSTLRNGRAAIKGLLTGLPIIIVRDEISEMAALVRRLAADGAFDVIHADQLSMAAWGLLAARAAAGTPGRPSTVLDEHNAIYMLTQRMAAEETRPLRRLMMTREARAFARYEAAMCRAYDAVFTVTEEDRGHLLRLSPIQLPDFSEKPRGLVDGGDKFTVIPICVDPDTVQPVWERKSNGAGVNGREGLPGEAHHPPGAKSPRPPTILHLGTMFWPPNVAGVLWFAREVLPRVWQAVPNARFVVVGKNPPAEVQALAADPRIEVTGYVPDPTPYLAISDAFVVPLHAGGGMRVKILDAWLWGQPVVATPDRRGGNRAARR